MCEKDSVQVLFLWRLDSNYKWLHCCPFTWVVCHFFLPGGRGGFGRKEFFKSRSTRHGPGGCPAAFWISDSWRRYSERCLMCVHALSFPLPHIHSDSTHTYSFQSTVMRTLQNCIPLDNPPGLPVLQGGIDKLFLHRARRKLNGWHFDMQPMSRAAKQNKWWICLIEIIAWLVAEADSFHSTVCEKIMNPLQCCYMFGSLLLWIALKVA